MAPGRCAARQQQCTGTVVDARGISSGDTATLTERRAELVQLLQRGVATRVFVVLDALGRAFALGDLDRHDFLCQAASSRLMPSPWVA